MNKRTKETMLYNYRRFQLSSDTELRHVYKSTSAKKEKAFRNCVSDMVWRNGTGIKILSHNCFRFVIGYEYPDKETGEARFLVDTGKNIYDEKLSDILA